MCGHWKRLSKFVRHTLSPQDTKISWWYRSVRKSDSDFRASTQADPREEAGNDPEIYGNARTGCAAACEGQHFAKNA